MVRIETNLGSSSGMIIIGSGYVLTNRHVIMDPTSVEAKLFIQGTIVG